MSVSNPKAFERSDCADLLARSRKQFDQARRALIWTVFFGFFVALLSLAMNLDALEITKINFGETEIVLKNLFLLRLFVTGASLGCVIVCLLCRELIKEHFRVIVFLAERKKYASALINREYNKWRRNDTAHSSLNNLLIALWVAVVGLYAILPLGTLLFSIVRG
jgi:hypothetical protein